MVQTEAMVIDRHGGPEVIERRQIELGELGPRQVLVQVKAASLNHLDIWVRRGGPAFKLEYPHRLGSDAAGIVQEVGSHCRGVAVGDRVMLHPARSCGTCTSCKKGHDNLCRNYRIMGESCQGTYSQHVLVDDHNLLPIGELDFAQAAALPLCTLTAWQMAYRKAELEPGMTVLINAAGSGVSSILIQLCKLAGVRVIASTSKAHKAERARELGADEVILSSEGNLKREVKRLTNKQGVDVTFDHVGGELFEQSMAATRWGGRIVICGASSGFAPKIDLRTIFFKQQEIRGSTMGRRGDLAAALPLIAQGKIKPIIDRVMPLWEAAEAHRVLEEHAAFGKVILRTD